MAKGKKQAAGRSRLAIPKTLTPDWFGWAGVAAMFLMMVVRIAPAGENWFFPLLSLGEWLLMPLGAASLTMGLLSLGSIRERTLLPLWLSAVLPGLLWLAAVGVSIILNGPTPAEGDRMLSWAVHLIFPAMAFLPLLAQRLWRNRLMWALVGGLACNIVVIVWQAFAGGDTIGMGRLALGGLLSNQHDYGMVLGIALPLLVAWRGGEIRSNRALVTLLCTFLLPLVAIGVCYTTAGLVTAAVGLAVAWAAWRSPAWLMGIFICLLVFGYGGTGKVERERTQRQLITETAGLGMDHYRQAFSTFAVSPYFGAGPGKFVEATTLPGTHVHADPLNPVPWYAELLGGSGLIGLGLWLALLAELVARALGRYGRNSLWAGGVVGGAAALAVAGLWTDVLPEGAGALVGLLLAVSVLEQPETEPSPRRAARRHEREVAAKVEAAKRETIIRIKGEEGTERSEQATMDNEQ